MDPGDGVGLTTLGKETINLLQSCQVVTSVWSCVKELLENSLDAGATTIEVRLEEYGMSKVTVRDNGCGVGTDQVQSMVLPHTTSKISSFSDMTRLTSYGFRGEALASLCSLARLSVTTRTGDDKVATCTSFNQQGKMLSSEKVAAPVGTNITACNLFSGLPVRRNYYKDVARRRDELRRVEKVMQGLAVVARGVRLALYNDGIQVWACSATSCLTDGLAGVIGRNLVNKLVCFNVWLNPESGEVEESQDMGLRLEGLVPKLGDGMGTETGRTGYEKVFVSVNKRPVEAKDIDKVLKSVFSEAAGLESDKYPVCCVAVNLEGDQLAKLDHNLEPNKQRVGLGCRDAVLIGLEKVLRNLWGLQVGISKDSQNTEESVLDISGNDSYAEMLKIDDDSNEDRYKTNLLSTVETNECFTSIGSTQQPLAKSTASIEEFLKIGSTLESSRSTNLIKVVEDAQSNFDLAPSQIGQFAENTSVGDSSNEIPNIITVVEDINDKSNFDLCPSQITQMPSGSDQYAGHVNYGGDDCIWDKPKTYSRFPPNDRPRHVPVLTEDMFEDPPNLPGYDALYLATCKEGEDEDLDTEEIRVAEPKSRPRNPFIEYECSEGSEDREKPNYNTIPELSKVSTDNKENNDFSDQFAKGVAMTTDGEVLQPVTILSTNRTGTKRKNEADKSCIRIDDFLAQRSSKSARRSVGNLTLQQMVNVNGTPKMKVASSRLTKEKEVQTLPFRLSRCKSRRDEKSNDREPVSSLVGQLSLPSTLGWCWILRENTELVLLAGHKLRETILWDRLMSSHVLPSEKLSEPVVLYPGGRLGEDQANLLANMFTNEKQCPVKVTDRRVTFNGFEVGLYQHQDGSKTLKLEARCPDIKFMGVDDLVEIINHVKENPKQDTVKGTRPSKIRNHLAEQATRLARDLSQETDKAAVMDMVNYRLEQGLQTCIHGHSLTRTLCSLDEEEADLISENV